MFSKIFRRDPNAVYVMPIGGVEQVGLNMTLYGYRGKWLMVDIGIGFGIPDAPGAEAFAPDHRIFEWLGDSLVGIVVTHAHEDHIGAIPYFLPHIRCPIYAGRFAGAFLRHRLKDEGQEVRRVDLLKPDKSYDIGPFGVEPVRVPHSIPESYALVLTVDKHKVLHTGDWKIDPGLSWGSSDALFRRLKEKTGDDLLAVVGDSTNAGKGDVSGDEGALKPRLYDAIKGQKNAVAVTLFASNLERLLAVAEAGVKAKRRCALLGRSLWRIYDVAESLGMWNPKIRVLQSEEIERYPRSRILFIVTGCQGEPRAALSRIAADAHPKLRLEKGDTVIYSSAVIPGNELEIAAVQNTLAARGVNVIGENRELHASGHAGAKDILRMYETLKPKSVVPVHGEWRHRQAHRLLALESKAKRVPMPANGECVDLITGKVTEGCKPRIYAIEGDYLIPVDGERFARRLKMSRNGEAVASCLMKNNRLVPSSLLLSLPGIEDEDDGACSNAVIDEVEAKLLTKTYRNPEGLMRGVKSVVKRSIKTRFDIFPSISVHVHAVGPD